MLSDKMLSELSRQINQEFSSAYYYLGLCGYCELCDFSGAAKFFKLQYNEELMHAMKLFDYVVQRHSGEVKLADIKTPKMKVDSLKDAFDLALKNEQETTKGVYKVLDLVHDERDYATRTLMNWFAEEQAEEESLMEHYVKRLRLVGTDGPGLLMIDNELGQRQPAAAG